VQKEWRFIANRGLWYGFLLGWLQMLVALFWQNPWSLPLGGAIVGMATNWMALQWNPIHAVQVGSSFTLQDLFLRRQSEVAAGLSSYYAQNVLNAEQIWKTILTDPTTEPAFAALFSQHVVGFVRRISRGLGVFMEPEALAGVADQALAKLPQHVWPTYQYMDKALGLENTLRVKMEEMSRSQFELFLRPIFAQDKLTLLLTGAVIGFAGGLFQRGLKTGALRLPSMNLKAGSIVEMLHKTRTATLQDKLSKSIQEGEHPTSETEKVSSLSEEHKIGTAALQDNLNISIQECEQQKSESMTLENRILAVALAVSFPLLILANALD
jgi:hypothetical protein